MKIKESFNSVKKYCHTLISLIKENTTISFILFSISSGGFLSLYSDNIISSKVISYFKKSDISEFFKINGKSSNSYVIFFVIDIIISILFFAYIPWAKKDKKSYDKFLGFIIYPSLLISLVTIGLSILFQKDITWMTLTLLWIFFTFFILQLGRRIKSIYSWLQTEKDNQFDVVKLSFIWGIIATLLTLLNK